MKTTAAILAAAMLLATPIAAYAATPPLIIEQSQARLLPHGSLPNPWPMSEHRPFSTGVEHYTRTLPCPRRHFNYVATCLSLEQSPPPFRSTAIYDPEKWALTSRREHHDFCGGMRLAVRLIRIRGAVPMISVPEMQDPAMVRCAARYSDYVIFQIQPHEADTADYMHRLRLAARQARSVRPGVNIAFVLSTAERYGATPAEMTADYQAAEAYLGGDAAWWLDVIPNHVDPSQPVALAQGLLAGIG